MINNLAKEFSNRWKFVNDLTAVEICYKNFASVLNDIVQNAKELDTRLNPCETTKMLIRLLKSELYFLNSIPPENSVSFFKLSVVII